MNNIYLNGVGYSIVGRVIIYIYIYTHTLVYKQEGQGLIFLSSYQAS